MKKSTMNLSTIALAALALVLSGGFAMAGDFGDINQNDNGPSGGGSGHRTLVKPRSTLKVQVAAGQSFDIDQNDNGPRGGGGRQVTEGPEGPKTDPTPGGLFDDDRFVGICLLPTIMGGRVICWN